MGKDCIDNKIKKSMYNIGKIISNRYWSLGYRGFFDIDFIVSKNKTLFPIETNTRRTGGTHVFDLTKKIFGKYWDKKIVVLSFDSFNYGKTIFSAEIIIEKMSKITFPINGENEGVVITIISQYKPVFGFIIFASNKHKVMKIYKKLTTIWNKDIVK